MGAYLMNYEQLFKQAGSAYGTDPGLLLNMGRLESGLRPDAANNWDSNATKGTPSKGLMQFIEPTFSGYARHAKEANPAAWAGVPMQWLNPKAQALAASWAIANGHGSAWTTYDRAKAAAGNRSGSDRRISGGGMNAGPTAPVAVAQPQSSNNAALAFVLQGSPYEGMSMPQPSAPRALGSRTESPISAPATSYRQIQRLGQKLFGLHNDPGDHQTTGGSHTQGSEHYEGRAVDFGSARNTPAQLRAWYNYAKSHGYDVLDEGNHIHVSVPGGGI